MKFFTCCNKEDTQTIEPQILEEKTDQLDYSEQQHDVSSQSSIVDVSFPSLLMIFVKVKSMLVTKVRDEMCS